MDHLDLRLQRDGRIERRRIREHEGRQNPVQRDVLSLNRQRWIETMRDIVASLTSQLIAAAAVRNLVEEPTGVVIARDRELLKRVENLLRTMSKVAHAQPARAGSSKAQCLLMKKAVDQVRSPLPAGGIEDRIEIIGRDIIQVS